jgi:hypothetical protein
LIFQRILAHQGGTMRVSRVDRNIGIGPDAIVNVKECGNVAVVRYSQVENKKPHIIKINKDKYIILSEGTGELHDFKHNENRAQDPLSIKESLERLRDYINTNVTKTTNCRWLTLTYQNNITDPKQLYSDFKKFNRKARKKYGTFEYIAVAEPQARGAWHLHCILIFKRKAPFMKNKDVADIWENGFVTVRKINSVDDVGRYLTAYLSDMTFDELSNLPLNVKADKIKVIEMSATTGKKQSKLIIKGERLKLYPPGFHFYRISKGIKPPVVSKMTFDEALDHFNDWTLTNQMTYLLTDDDDDDKRSFFVSKQYYKKYVISQKKRFSTKNKSNDNKQGEEE